MQPILKINLSTGEVREFVIPRDWQRDFLGGASLAARILYSDITPDLDPLSPQAPLLFLTGPLTGTAGPAVGRFVVCGKSPATGLWAESNCGGFWGPELRSTGYDGLWITGKSEKPVYLWLHSGKLEIRDAAHLIGLDTYEVQDLIKNETKEKSARVACIGLAGENCIKYASILCDHGRAAGRTGLGAVMGSKNLKAIAVRGYGSIVLADKEKFSPIRSASNRSLRQDPVSLIANQTGTAGVADYFDYMGAMVKKYFHAGVFEGVDKISGATMAETILSGVSACHACVIACGRVVRLSDGEQRKGPEYETIVGFGPNLLNDDLASITMLGELCDRYGMDTISASNTIGLAYHLFELGLITENDTGGFSLEWKDPKPAEKLIHMIAHREGIGKLMAEGAREFARYFGVADEAVQVNGLEVAYHDPRGVSGMALVYATSPRGACHNQSDYFLVDTGQADASLGLEFFPRQANAEKAGNVARHQDWRTVCNSLVLCLFANAPAETVVKLFNLASGFEITLDDMIKSGERGWNLKRAINNRLGLTRANDKLPKALLEPLNEGGAGDYVPDLQAMLSAYYTARDWDPLSGKPSCQKLVSLGLQEPARDLWGIDLEQCVEKELVEPDI